MFCDPLVFRPVPGTGTHDSPSRIKVADYVTASGRMREGIEDYELLMESARHARERTDALARTVMPTFTEYLRDVTQFRKFERELLALAAEAQGE